MSDYHFIDNTIISDLSRQEEPRALDALYSPKRTLVITTTVYDEAIRYSDLYDDAAARKAWLADRRKVHSPTDAD